MGVYRNILELIQVTEFFGVCVVAGQSTPLVKGQLVMRPSVVVSYVAPRKDMPVIEGIVEVVPVGLAETHVVVVYGQVECFLLRIRREHDVVENDLIAVLHVDLILHILAQFFT